MWFIALLYISASTQTQCANGCVCVLCFVVVSVFVVRVARAKPKCQGLCTEKVIFSVQLETEKRKGGKHVKEQFIFRSVQWESTRLFVCVNFW